MPPDVVSSPQRRPDASMSLLADIAGDALDPGYAVAAARSRLPEEPGERHRSVSPLLGVGVLLATLLVVVAAVQAHVRAPVAAKNRSDLVTAVNGQSRAVADLARQVDALRERTTQLRDRTLAGSAAGAELAARVHEEELAAGQVPVAGPGLTVTLDDRSSDAGNRLQDRDLQVVVNALWAAGAEAIAVNGQRLTSQSAIREAGEAILVDFQPLRAPYVIAAVGDAARLQASYDDSSAGARIRGYRDDAGLRVDVARHDQLRLAAAADEMLHYARPVPSARASGSGS